MIIAVNTRQPHDNFIVASVTRLALKYPEHQFIYLLDKDPGNQPADTENTRTVIAGPAAGSPLRWQYWYNYRLPSLLKKYKADVFVAADGICSLRTKLPQCLIVNDLSFLLCPQFVSKSHTRFFKRFTPRFIEKAKGVATHTGFYKLTLEEKYKAGTEKIRVIPRSVPAPFRPLDWKIKDKVKEKYTDGKEYFLFSGAPGLRSNLLNLLKAFSFFKKRQKSNMQLLIALQEEDPDKGFTTALGTFKFRNEVKVLPGLRPEELAELTAAAYAFVYPVLFDDDAAQPMQALQCEVPVIISGAGSFREIFGDAALYADPADFNDLAGKMMHVFKNEQDRENLVMAGRQILQQYDSEKADEMLWDLICSACK